MYAFRFDPLSIAFSNRCVFDENTQRISVDGRPKRIEMYALMWTGPQTSVMYPCLKISYCL